MPLINILSPRLADMIAAGEVVERPASAVKELIENAFDAGAKNVTVELRSGGAEYIRVTDDGCGMAPEDAGVCFLRHATSKLSCERDLEAIGTMGFRGEALAAIASVSHIELSTRRRGAETGTYMTLEAGDIAEMREQGCPVGTTIIIRGLFFNTPARLKFLKTDRAEGAACCQAALRCALGRPEVSVRCIKDGEEQFFTPGDGRAESAVYTLLGRDIAAAMLPISSEDGGIAASGFISSPSAGRGSRSMQYFFCNGRYIKSLLLQSAVEQAYKNNLLVGRYPACCVYLTLAPGSVDVNVHPAKTEVKFSDEKKVFDAVYYAALGALTGKPEQKAPAKEPPKPPARESAVYYAPASATRDSAPIREPQLHYQTRLDLPPARPASPVSRPASYPASSVSNPPSSVPRPSSSAPYPPSPASPYSAKSIISPKEEEAPRPVELSAAAESGAVRGVSDDVRGVSDDVKVVGEVLNLYIVAEQGGALYLIDKHAAHERIIFNALQSRGGENMCQTLLVPVPVNAAGDMAELIEENAHTLSELGFEAEPYGEGAYILRAVPAGIDPASAESAFTEALDALSQNKRLDKNAARDEALKTIACKAAIKAGYITDPLELQKLAESVCSGEITHCPHGRPVAWKLTREDLDKQFKRIL